MQRAVNVAFNRHTVLPELSYWPAVAAGAVSPSPSPPDFRQLLNDAPSGRSGAVGTGFPHWGGTRVIPVQVAFAPSTDDLALFYFALLGAVTSLFSCPYSSSGGNGEIWRSRIPSPYACNASASLTTTIESKKRRRAGDGRGRIGEVAEGQEQVTMITPSAELSVAYLKSELATAAAANIRSGEYLALILDPRPSPKDYNPLINPSGLAVANPVQPSGCLLLAAYFPIAPCRIGPREPFLPNFHWPFGECVLETSRRFVFKHISLDLDIANAIPCDAADEAFSSVASEDWTEQMGRDSEDLLACEEADREAAGMISDEDLRTILCGLALVLRARRLS
ncbi:hypothetical protein DFH09DRAFT_1273139 [Mycena vulgaris]|nr:hypothetical protein DFH09DRAFT_1273139 [Mycena vulgaris]